MSGGGADIRVLHVEDNQAFARTVAEHLKREVDSISVTVAATASEGLECLDEQDIHCVVADYKMDGMDGLTFLDAVRDRDPDLPFILYTGKGSESVASEAISAGVTDYVEKGSGVDQFAILANSIDNAVERYRLDQRETRQLRAIESAREGISILDESGEFLYVNEAYADLYGYDRSEMVGEHWSLIYPETEIELTEEVVLPTVWEEGYWHGETTGLRADGSTFPEDHVVSKTRDDDLVCTVRDISDARERESELWLKTRAMDEAPVGVTISDYRREDNPLIYVNDHFTEITGYDREETLGRNCRFLQGEGTAEEPVTEMAAAIDAGEPVTVELRNYTATDEEFWNRVRIAPIRNADGDLTHFVGFQEDISDRKERERRLEQTNQRLEEFASLVSHDLRNPLNVVQGRVDLAIAEGDLDHLEPAMDAIDRSLALIEDLLTLAREGRDLGAVTSVSLADVAEESWETVSTEEATIELDTTQTISADQSRLRQLLENLFRNAVEHAGPAVNVRVGDLATGFYVADDGPGIPADERDQIFDAGYSTRTDSTGFGLSIVQEVAVAHDWSVSVSESESGGARFEITGVSGPEGQSAN